MTSVDRVFEWIEKSLPAESAYLDRAQVFIEVERRARARADELIQMSRAEARLGPIRRNISHLPVRLDRLIAQIESGHATAVAVTVEPEYRVSYLAIEPVRETWTIKVVKHPAGRI